MAQPQISQVNPNVPSTAQVPDTYLYISTVPTTITTAQPKNLFLVATAILAASQILNAPYSLTAGTAVANEIAQYSDVTRVNLAFNRRSPIANRFRNAIQEIPIGINIFCASIMEPSNSGFAGFATKLLTFAGTAQGSGEITIRACGHECRVPVANGDTAAVIATDAKTTLDRYIPDAPMVTAGIIASTTVPLTYVVRGEDGNDSPVLVYIPPEITGITVSPGTITVTTNAIGNSASRNATTRRIPSRSWCSRTFSRSPTSSRRRLPNTRRASKPRRAPWRSTPPSSHGPPLHTTKRKRTQSSFSSSFPPSSPSSPESSSSSGSRGRGETLPGPPPRPTT
jgi:hypothetical protein